MTEVDSSERNLDPKIKAQVDHIRAAFGEDKIGILTFEGGVRYMYAKGELLVREDYLARVQAHLGQRQSADADEVRPVIAGIVLLTIADSRAVENPEAFDRLVGTIDEALGEGVATPNHLLTVAGEIGPCPATEPQVAYDGIEPYPSVRQDDGGAGVRVYVADTGLLPDVHDRPWLKAHSWLAGVRGDHDPLAPPPGQVIPPYTGHGTFVAGVLRCMAPAADIVVASVFSTAGSALESDFVRKLQKALHQGYDIFHLSVTAPTRNDRPLPAVEKWLKQLREHKGVVCVAAAGNSGSHLPSWPAASRDVVSVGALAADWRSRALFSNYGPWVDVYAPGRDIINAYTTGTYVCQFPPYTNKRREFHDMAKWSGTSFSTPIVTGIIAARMTRTGENGQAAAAVLAEARSRAIPGVGPILLPYDRCVP